MRNLLERAGLLVLVAGITSCSTVQNQEKPELTDEQKEFGPTGIPPELRSRSAATATAVAPGGNTRNPSGLKRTPIEDIVFTNSDGTQVPELTELLAAPKSKIWEDSDTIARRRSAREGKPLLIWFSSNQSPNCLALEQELFSRADFGAWATEKLVRLKVDATFKITDLNLSMDEKDAREVELKHHVEAMKKRYRVMGQPTLILLNPGGEVLGRWTGYKRGTAEFTWGLLKHGEEVSTRAYASWRAGMEKKGYREWKDRLDRKAFAKLISYDKGVLILIDPDGSRFRTHEDKLCDADRAWIAEQKEIRNLP